MDADALLTEHDSRLRKWAGRAVRQHPITFDEAFCEIQRGFVEGAGTWRAEGGASLLGHCRTRAFGAVKDYCRSIEFAGRGSDSKLATEPATERDLPFGDAIGNAEFWAKVWNVLFNRHRREWLFVNLIHREGWTGRQVAKYFGISEPAVSQCHRRALARLAASYSLRRFLRGERGQSRKVPKRPPPANFKIPYCAECCELDCHLPVKGRGKCAKHYYRDLARRRANPDAPCRHAPIGTFACRCGGPAGASRECVRCQNAKYVQRKREQRARRRAA